MNYHFRLILFGPEYTCTIVVQRIETILVCAQKLLHFSLCNHHDLQQNYKVMASEAKMSMLQQLFNRARPKARYISETHIEQETTSIAKEIINGDIQVNKTKQNLDKAKQKDTFEDMMRKKYMEQIEREKEELEHKLGYIQNSLTSFEKYQYMRKRSSLQENLSLSRKNNQEWRKEFEQQMKRIQQKKKQIAEKSKEKELQTQQIRQKMREEEKAKQRGEIEESINKIKSRSQQRQQIVKEEKDKLKQILNKKELFQKMQEKFSEKQEHVLQQRKKKLAEIRQLKHPINLQQILQHEQKVLEILKQKQSVREMEKKMNSSRARSYRPSYQSNFYKQLIAPVENENEESAKQKLQKMKQFSQQVKSKFAPQIDDHKRRQIEQKLEKEVKTRADRQEKQKELIQKPKLKGLQYLQLVKRLPKKKDSPPPTAPISDRIQYKNYLGNMSMDMSREKPWKTILKKGGQKVQTAQMLQIQSQKLQQRLKRREEYVRLMKFKDDGAIDQQYYDMVKAKLDLLAKE